MILPSSVPQKTRRCLTLAVGVPLVRTVATREGDEGESTSQLANAPCAARCTFAPLVPPTLPSPLSIAHYHCRRPRADGDADRVCHDRARQFLHGGRHCSAEQGPHEARRWARGHHLVHLRRG